MVCVLTPKRFDVVAGLKAKALVVVVGAPNAVTGFPNRLPVAAVWVEAPNPLAMEPKPVNQKPQSKHKRS